MIPVSVIVATRNEEQRIGACLSALSGFGEIIVVDSHSPDNTAAIAKKHGARVEQFQWNGFYPKKRQWCLDHLQTKYHHILFIDADEIMTSALYNDITGLDWHCSGYFICGQPVWRGKILRHGLWNNKLCLLDKTRVRFPDVNDLDIPGMGEMEGHYQPLLIDGCAGQLHAPLLHHCEEGWQARHERYALWEAAMIERAAYPRDPVHWRETLKGIFRRLPCRAALIFIYGYIFKGGFLDGRAGLSFACAKASYYRLVAKARCTLQ